VKPAKTKMHMKGQVDMWFIKCFKCEVQLHLFAETVLQATNSHKNHCTK